MVIYIHQHTHIIKLQVIHKQKPFLHISVTIHNIYTSFVRLHYYKSSLNLSLLLIIRIITIE